MMKYKCVKQINETDCGIACIATICEYHNVKYNLSDIRRNSKIDQYGVNFLGLYDALNKLGFDAECLEGTVEELVSEKNIFPCIGHFLVDGFLEHYMVVFEINDNSVLVADPAEGLKQLSFKQFSETWTGHIIAIKQNNSNKLNNKIRDKHNKNRLIVSKIISDCKGILLALILCSTFASCLEVLSTLLTMYIVDFIFPKKQASMIIEAVIFTSFILLVLILLDSLKAKMHSKIIQITNTNAINKFIFNVLHLKYNRFEQYTSGDYLSRIQDIDTVRETIIYFFIALFSDSIILIVGGVFLIHLSKTLFIVAIIILATYIILASSFCKSISNSSKEFRNSDAKVTTKVLEITKGLITIKSFCAEKNECESTSESIKEYMKKYSKLYFLFSEQAVLSNGVQRMSDFLILAIGCYYIVKGSLTWGTVIAFNILFSLCFPSANKIIELIPAISRAKISLQRLQMIEDEPKEDNTMKNIDFNGTDIIISNVNYRYGNRDLVLNNASLEIKAGESVALIGGNGSGKSTLAKLLVKMYEPESGTIEFGGNDFENLPPYDIRKKIIYIPQDTFVFRGSVLDNLKLGITNIKNEEIISELERLNILSYFEGFDLGIDSIITENGDNLSGGQKQLICIVRALLKKPDILILDEATNSIDKDKEEKIMDLILNFNSGTSKIIISHSPHIVKKCDKIIVVENGTITGIGNHNELIKENYFYRDFIS